MPAPLPLATLIPCGAHIGNTNAMHQVYRITPCGGKLLCWSTSMLPALIVLALLCLVIATEQHPEDSR
jgi:hypothetical protein